jgi:RNA recognition motif-containing protein
MKLYVGNLPFSHTEEDVRKLFAAYPSLKEITLVKDQETGRSRGFAFAEFGSDEEALRAVSDLNNKTVGTSGRALVVNEARPRESRPPRGDGGGRDRPFNKNRR